MNMRQAIKKKKPGEEASSSASTPAKKRTSKTDYDPLNGDL
jgi:hypothetical protein